MNGEIIEMQPAEALSFLSQTILWDIYQWGIEVIKVIQRIENPFLTTLVKCITALGTEALYLPLILFIFWWIDEKQGLRFGLLIIVSAWINGILKDLLKQPRPYNLDPSVGLAHEPSYGAPSGHAQMSLCFWISVAAWLNEKPRRKRALIWTGTVFFILLIGFTRLYLGVHFPTDLFAGWIIGGIILAVWFIPGPLFEKHFTSAGIRVQNISIAIFALVMNGLYPQDRSLPALLLGFYLGYNLMKTKFPFSARGEINGKKPGVRVMLLRCLTGFLGLAVIYLGLKLLFPGEGSLFRNIPAWGEASPYYELGRFIRYGLVGLWASAGAPRMFQRMGLAHNSEKTGDNSGAAS